MRESTIPPFFQHYEEKKSIEIDIIFALQIENCIA